MIEHDHHLPQDLTQALADQQQIFINSSLRVMEFMFLQMEAILKDFPDAQTLSFELDDNGGTDSIPMFYVVGEDKNENFGDLPEIEAIAQEWNDHMHPGVVHFLTYANSFELTRENLASDRSKLIEQLSKSLPLSTEEQEHWKQSFNSFLKKRDLEAIAGQRTQDMPAAKKKPGM